MRRHAQDSEVVARHRGDVAQIHLAVDHDVEAVIRVERGDVGERLVRLAQFKVAGIRESRRDAFAVVRLIRAVLARAVDHVVVARPFQPDERAGIGHGDRLAAARH